MKQNMTKKDTYWIGIIMKQVARLTPKEQENFAYFMHGYLMAVSKKMDADEKRGNDDNE